MRYACSMRFFFTGFISILLLSPAACGGKVVVDAPGGQGGAGGATSTSSSSSAPPSGTGGGAHPFCAAACGALSSKGCVGGACVDRCESTLGAAPSCIPAAEKAATCIADHAAGAPACSINVCEPSLTDLESCLSAATCEKAIIGGQTDTGGCVGKGVCGSAEWSATCDANGGCTCMSDTVVLGTCQEAGPFLCDFSFGCCGPLFLLGG